jgi:hypothetical protein
MAFVKVVSGKVFSDGGRRRFPRPYTRLVFWFYEGSVQGFSSFAGVDVILHQAPTVQPFSLMTPCLPNKMMNVQQLTVQEQQHTYVVTFGY